MNAIKIRKKKERKILWDRAIKYIYLIILSCCLTVVNNLHPYEEPIIENEKSEMIYIFHDYAGNQYILNNSAHWSASSREYLFNEEVPEEFKNDDDILEINLSTETGNQSDTIHDEEIISIDLQNNSNENAESWNLIIMSWTSLLDKEDSELKKDNQVSLNDIMDELWVESENDKDSLIIDGNKIQLSDEDWYYKITEFSEDESKMVIEWQNGYENNSDWNETNENLTENITLDGESFKFLNSGLVLPTLIPREDINFLWYSEYDSDNNLNWNNSRTTQKWEEEELEPGIHIIDDYADCMTPWGYKIEHGESILAYQQLKNAPNICNIERRFCWNGKLSGTYNQQWCSVNEDYSYEVSWQAEVVHHEEKPKWETKQNPDWSVTVVKKEVWTDFLLDRPSRTYTYDIGSGDNIVTDVEEIDQTERVHRDCTTPRWEKVKHGQFIYAYKHANGFSDSRCEMQIRLCSMWKLNWSYKNSTCKTRDTSFIDWINNSPTWDTYSKAKLDWVKEQIKYEKSYDKEYWRITDSDALDRILTTMDK